MSNFMNWENPGIALITGASSGIGAAYAKNLANQGFNTILIARRENKLKQLAFQLSETTSTESKILVADLSKLVDIKKISEFIQSTDNIDILINNAGFGTRGYFENIPIDVHEEMIFVHNLAPVYFCRAVLPNMIEKNRGIIINVSSMAAFNQRPQYVMYGATKTFLKVFSEALHYEMHDTEIKIQALCPGWTQTEFHIAGYLKSSEEQIPKDTWMTAEEVVELSLRAITEDMIVFIPGVVNQKFQAILTDPKMGKRVRENQRKIKMIPR